MKDRTNIERLKMDANVAKERLIEIMYKLEEERAIREARTLEAIICKLEAWQNK